MQEVKLYLSKTAPARGAWVKPVPGGFALFMRDNGTWQSVKAEDNSDAPSVEDAIKSVVGKSGDAASKPTLYGVKKHADTAYIKSGTFAKKPASPSKGQMYFCTDKQTVEGETDGIAIFWNGTKWVDALGRVVS